MEASSTRKRDRHRQRHRESNKRVTERTRNRGKYRKAEVPKVAEKRQNEEKQ